MNRYSSLRNELAAFQQDFEMASARHPHFCCERLLVFDFVSSEGWHQFADSSRCDAEAEQWVILPTGEGCLRFYGDLTGFETFRAMANSAWLILVTIATELPELNLDLGQIGNEFGWLDSVFHTAEAVASPRLYVKGGWWSWVRDESPNDALAVNAIWEGEGEARYHRHPMVQRLPTDVFQASAQAIRVWLDPDVIPTVADRIDYLSIRLPDTCCEVIPAAPAPSERPSHAPIPNDDAILTLRQSARLSEELSTRDAAAFLKVSVDTLKAHVQAGRLPRRNISPHGSSRGPFLYKVSDLTKLRDGDYRRTVPRGQPKAVKGRKTTLPPEPHYDDLDL